MDWRQLVTDEDLFGYELLQSEGVADYLKYQWLRLRSGWGSREAEDELSQLIAIGLVNSDRSSGRRTGGVGGVEGKMGKSTGEEVYSALQLASVLVGNPREEMSSLVRAIGGEYVLPAPGTVGVE